MEVGLDLPRYWSMGCAVVPGRPTRQALTPCPRRQLLACQRLKADLRARPSLGGNQESVKLAGSWPIDQLAGRGIADRLKFPYCPPITVHEVKQVPGRVTREDQSKSWINRGRSYRSCANSRYVSGRKTSSVCASGQRRSSEPVARCDPAFRSEQRDGEPPADSRESRERSHAGDPERQSRGQRSPDCAVHAARFPHEQLVR